jgi:hypothetical protein
VKERINDRDSNAVWVFPNVDQSASKFRFCAPRQKPAEIFIIERKFSEENKSRH